jgi:hypothetical protein
VFTARYALSPYIKQIRLVFRGLIECSYSELEKVLVQNFLYYVALLHRDEVLSDRSSCNTDLS